MREILFRGKKVDNSKWVYGMPCSDLKCGINSIQSNNDGGIYDVIPETVGQYTGLTDKNGVKVFEGDIVKVGFDNYRIIWDNEQCCFTFVTDKGNMQTGCNNSTLKMCEIV